MPLPMLLETKQKLKVHCDSTALQKQGQHFLYLLPVLYQSEEESVKTEAQRKTEAAERFEKLSLNFSISLFVIRVNLLHP